RKGHQQLAPRPTGPLDARRGTEGVVPLAAEGLARPLEDLGQLAGDTLVANRPTESPARIAVLGRHGLRLFRWRRLEYADRRTQRNLRRGARLGDHGIHDCRGRSSRVLGRTAVAVAAAEAVRTGGRRVRRG